MFIRKMIRRSGFALMGVLISVFVTGLMVVAAGGAIVKASQLRQLCDYNETAALRAQSLIEKIKRDVKNRSLNHLIACGSDFDNEDPIDLNSVFGGELLPNEEISIEYPHITARPLLAVITISWGEQSNRRQREFYASLWEPRWETGIDYSCEATGGVIPELPEPPGPQ
ncbi:hypothetical protein ACFL38_02735 [Candidatus Omnitrophota bacterium]